MAKAPKIKIKSIYSTVFTGNGNCGLGSVDTLIDSPSNVY